MPKSHISIKSGDKFHRLTAIKFSHRDDNHAIHWLFKCLCGNVLKASKSNVISGSTKSCGCFKKEYLRSKLTSHGQAFDNNYSGAYRTWLAMKNRCNKDKNYLGVSYCEEWKYFENFYRDMGDRPKGLSIDRIDSSKDYSKENCRWTATHQQAMNCRKTTKKCSSKYKGISYDETQKKFRARIGLNYKRIHLGWFDTEEQAAKAYNVAAIKYHGYFALLNDV